MEEKVLNKKKNGMAMMLLFIALYIAAAILMCIGVDHSKPLCVVAVIYLGIGWIPFLGLKVLKPQEALVLTLFGNYVGTLKEAGFYFVNPFCTAVNPAAATKLNQSGIDAPTGGALSSLKISTGTTGEINAAQAASKKVSLKIMTLNNNRQKINDCLGNPIEIGIAVMWRVVDTAKAVFNVDNYKEYLSLQCDSALRNIVRIYPYDVSGGVDTTGDGQADEGSLRGSSEVVAERIRQEIQESAGGRISIRSVGKRRCRHTTKGVVEISTTPFLFFISVLCGRARRSRRACSQASSRPPRGQALSVRPPTHARQCRKRCCSPAR